MYKGERLALTLTAEKQELRPECIELVGTTAAEIVALSKMCSKFDWRRPPGRDLSFRIEVQGKVVGILSLANPVLNLSARDRYLGLSREMLRQAQELRNYLDMSICIGVQPLAWYWNLGKCIAMIAPTLSPIYQAKYGDELFGVTTTSLWGRSVQYNRIYKLLGFTKGAFTTAHVSEGKYAQICRWLRDNGIETKTGLHRQTRFERIQAYCRFANDSSVLATSGHQRGVYYHPAVDYDWKEAVQRWYMRWGLPRWKRTKELEPPYQNGLEGENAYRMAETT